MEAIMSDAPASPWPVAVVATSDLASAAPTSKAASIPSTSSLLHRRRRYREAKKKDSITMQQEDAFERKEQEKEEVEGELEGEPSSLASELPLSSSSYSSSDRVIQLRPCHAYHQLPVDLILLIAQYLDGRSLARLGSCDRTSRIVSQKSQLWEYLTQHTELQARWLDLNTILPISLTMRSVMRREMLTYLHPDPSSKFVPVRTAQFIYQTRYQIACRLRHYAQAICTLKSNEHYSHGRVRTMRMIEEVIVPPLIIFLVGWQLVNLALALDSPDAAADAATAIATAEPRVTIYTLVPLCLIYAILLASILNLFYVRWRHSFVMNLTKLMSSYFTPTSSDSPDNNSLYHASSVDTSWRFLPESYFSSSRSMMRQLLVRITPINHSREMEMMRHLILIVICMMPAIWLCLMQHLGVRGRLFSGGDLVEVELWNVFYPLIVPVVWMLYSAVRTSYISYYHFRHEDYIWMIYRGRRATELFLQTFAFNDEMIEVRRSERHEEG